MALTFSIDEYNVLTIGANEYFVQNVDGQLHVLPSRCPHRGGPLRLGRVEGGVVVCPWHGTRVPLSRCGANALPAVFRRHSKSVLVAENASEHGSKRLRWAVRAR
jgi:phenylpropionate dioxygenase-like ring-hydroxylating dioxygenase large terminal subunit